MNIIFEMKKVKEISKFLDLKFKTHDLKKFNTVSANNYDISNNTILFYPLNDGYPTREFKFYKNGKLVISNEKEFSELANLDDILINMVRIYDKAIDNGIVLDPYYFLLELTGEIKENYKGRAELVITEKAIRNQKLDENNFDEANKYFINHFLDHFMGWNFGVSINRNEILREELEELNNKVIDMGIREYAGSGYEVYGVESEASQGLQHYKLPIKKAVKKTKKLIKNDSTLSNWEKEHFDVIRYNE